MVGPPSSAPASRAQMRRRRTVAVACVLALLGVAVLIVRNGNGNGNGAAKGSAGGPRRSSAGPPPKASPRAADGTNAQIARLAALGLPVYCAGPRGNAVAFTFDDGPGPYTPLALRKLSQAHERATFFVVGRSMDNYPSFLAHELGLAAIGDHTYTHPQLTALSPDMITSELQRTKQKIERVSPQPVLIFRPPYGLRNPTVDQIAKRLGLLDIIWTVDSADSLGANYAGIITNVEAGLHPGAIILMHENRGQTIRALTTLLPELQRRGLRSVSVPELLASDPPSEAQVRQGRAGCGVSR